jgi:hypothetical protein
MERRRGRALERLQCGADIVAQPFEPGFDARLAAFQLSGIHVRSFDIKWREASSE